MGLYELWYAIKIVIIQRLSFCKIQSSHSHVCSRSCTRNNDPFQFVNLLTQPWIKAWTFLHDKGLTLQFVDRHILIRDAWGKRNDNIPLKIKALITWIHIFAISDVGAIKSNERDSSSIMREKQRLLAWERSFSLFLRLLLNRSVFSPTRTSFISEIGTKI